MLYKDKVKSSQPSLCETQDTWPLVGIRTGAGVDHGAKGCDQKALH